MEELTQHGFDGLTGADISPEMIKRARRLHPTTRFAALEAPPHSPYPDAGFDAVLLFTVLTWVPGDERRAARRRRPPESLGESHGPSVMAAGRDQ